MAKRKYIEVEAIRTISCHSSGEETEYELKPTVEIIEINSDMINAFTSDEKYYNETVVCRIKFLARSASQESYLNIKWSVLCTLEQATRNLKLIGKELISLTEDDNEKISIPKVIVQDKDSSEEHNEI